jgi:hypothetical protein
MNGVPSPRRWPPCICSAYATAACVRGNPSTNLGTRCPDTEFSLRTTPHIARYECVCMIAAIAAAGQALALIALHLVPTGYDPETDAVSDYGIGRYRGLFWAQGLAGATSRAG